MTHDFRYSPSEFRKFAKGTWNLESWDGKPIAILPPPIEKHETETVKPAIRMLVARDDVERTIQEHDDKVDRMAEAYHSGLAFDGTLLGETARKLASQGKPRDKRKVRPHKRNGHINQAGLQEFMEIVMENWRAGVYGEKDD